MNGFVGSLGGPTSTLFSAIIRYSYSLSSIRSTSLNVNVSQRSLLTRIQRVLDVKWRSMMYPRIGEPPSNSGSFQDNSALELNIAVNSTFCGGPGGSEI